MKLIIATEDELSESVVERLALGSSSEWVIIGRVRRNGNGYLRTKLPGLLRTSAAVPVFLLTDLDLITCAPALVREWLGRELAPLEMRFRVAVREVEAWLLADKEGFSSFLGIHEDYFPEDPESLSDPKQELLNLVRRHGSREMKAELLPASGAMAKVGLGYNSTLKRFVSEFWDPTRASRRSDSLARAIRRL